MDTPRREVELAQLQAHREQLQRQLARVEREIVQARRRMNAAEDRIACLTQSQQHAA